MDALGVERADVYPKVSEHIPEIIALVERLIDNGHAYAADGNVFSMYHPLPSMAN